MSKVDEVHVVLTNYGESGWSATSPQLPGLIAGAATLHELSDEFFDIAVEAGMAPEGSIYEYQQQIDEVDDRLFAVRVKSDGYEEERIQLAEEVHRQLRSEDGLRAHTAVDELGDSVILACLPTDKLADVTASLEFGQPVTIAVNLDHRISYTGIQRGGEKTGGAMNLRDVGLQVDDTVASLFETLLSRANSSSEVVEHELVLA